MLKQFAALGVVLLGVVGFMSSSQAQQRPGYQGNNDRIECTSRDYRYERCDVNWSDAQLVRQVSNTRCIRGQNWGVDRRGLWVDRGCGGVFAATGRRPGGSNGYNQQGPGAGWDRDIRLSCSSNDFRYRFCQVDLGAAGKARITRQLSQTACIEGRTWGSNRAGIWVDNGCAAEFTVGRRSGR